MSSENIISGFRSTEIYDFTVVGSLKVNRLAVPLEKFDKNALENYHKAQKNVDDATKYASSTDLTSAIECEAPSISSQNEQRTITPTPETPGSSSQNEQSAPITCTSTPHSQTATISGNGEAETSTTTFHPLGDCSFEQLLLNTVRGNQNSTAVPTKRRKIASAAKVLTCQDVENRVMKKNCSSTVVGKQTRHRRSSSESDEDVPLESDSDVQSDDDTPLVDENRPTTTGDFILARFATNRRVRHYVGQVLKVDGDEYSVQFMRCLNPRKGTFVWPENEDISSIETDAVVMLLPVPSVNRREIFSFGVDLSKFNM